MALGQSAELILKGNQVTSERLTLPRFKFQFETLSDALDDIFGKKKITIEKLGKEV